jgi:hypothetical protein
VAIEEGGKWGEISGKPCKVLAEGFHLGVPADQIFGEEPSGMVDGKEKGGTSGRARKPEGFLGP